MSCPFCHLDYSDIANTVIDKSENFLILPSKGSLCNGYLLIIPKEHINSMNELTDTKKEELLLLIKKYREKFYLAYNKYPILFEHGSSKIDNSKSSSSVTHAHIHIINHNFLDENKLIIELNLQEVNVIDFFENKNDNYISYISPTFKFYISYNFKPISQQMRICIANDLKLPTNYNWKTSNFDDNIISTINTFKKDNLEK